MPAHPDIGKIVHRRWRMSILSIVAKGCLSLGPLCSGHYAIAQADPHVTGSAAMSAFREARRAVLADAPDQSLWSSNRRTGYRESLAADLGAPDGLLYIPAIGLSVPIFEGTTELVLNRGIGWIEGTARPGARGNVGLAGHRDGFFRGVKDLAIGDAIELQTGDGTLSYRVTEFLIVDPTEVSVLEPTLEPALTLVTCYPFYFVGHAPQRYIVRGVLGSRVTGGPDVARTSGLPGPSRSATEYGLNRAPRISSISD